MANIPNNCLNCIFESRCNAAMNMSDCNFAGLVDTPKPSVITRLKNYFGKYFK